MASIAGLLPSDVVVLRDGEQRHIEARELVTGDLVLLSLGKKLPADLRFVEVSLDLRLDRAVLTGESEPIPGTVDQTDVNMLETKNIGLQGTLCVGGSGMGMFGPPSCRVDVRSDREQVSSYKLATTPYSDASPACPARVRRS